MSKWTDVCSPHKSFSEAVKQNHLNFQKQIQILTLAAFLKRIIFHKLQGFISVSFYKCCVGNRMNQYEFRVSMKIIATTSQQIDVHIYVYVRW